MFRGRLPRVLLDTGRFDLRPPTLEDHLRTLVVATDPEALSAAAVQLAAEVGTCLAALAADTPRLSADLAAAADELRDLIRQTRVDLASSQPIRAAAGLARLQTEIDTTVLGIAPGATGVTDDHHRQARAAREAAGLPDLLDGTTDPGRALTTIDARLAQMCAVT